VGYRQSIMTRRCASPAPSHFEANIDPELPGVHRREREVLVVEDDPDLRQMMVQMLTLEGFGTQSARDGQDALDHLRAFRPLPDVILLDMMMPRMDGWQFCREQQADPALRDIRVMVLSAAPRDRLDVGAAEVILKPFNHDTLLAAIRR
jgi:two-component system chemotaxis response regulator CheY